MNNKAQASIFTIVFIIIIFVIILAVGLAPLISFMSSLAVSMGGLTGLEAFMIGNLLLFIIIAFFIWALWNTR